MREPASFLLSLVYLNGFCSITSCFMNYRFYRTEVRIGKFFSCSLLLLAEKIPGIWDSISLYPGYYVQSWVWAVKVSIVPAWLNRVKFLPEHGRSGHTNILLVIRLNHLYLPDLTGSANTLPRKEDSGISTSLYAIYKCQPFEPQFFF
jgi:hypothetical protein